MMNKRISLKTARTHHPREFTGFRFVYPVVSRRSGGISIGINLNPEKKCNFSCAYCQVDRKKKAAWTGKRTAAVILEVERMLRNFSDRGICTLEQFNGIPENRKLLKDIAISGDGEPTLFSGFIDLCKNLHIIQEGKIRKFKLVLITNGTLLGRKPVLQGLDYLLKTNGEIWAKLDAGSEEWHNKVHNSKISLDRVQKSLIRAGQRFPLKIQSLFCKIKGKSPSSREIALYTERLKALLQAGVEIPEVQLSTVVRKPFRDWCKPVSKAFLFKVRQRIFKDTGLKVCVY
jgi:wyosine [tRNA(Phe)-imidazoG37] synthetase (radical SAM superfamily)